MASPVLTSADGAILSSITASLKVTSCRYKPLVSYNVDFKLLLLFDGSGQKIRSGTAPQ